MTGRKKGGAKTKASSAGGTDETSSLPPVDALGAELFRLAEKELRARVTDGMTPQEIEVIASEIRSQTEKVIKEVMREAPREIADGIDATGPARLARRHRERRAFERRLRTVWGKALYRLDELIVFFRDFGEAYHSEMMRPDVEGRGVLSDTLTQLHARACRVAYEIFVQLEAGLADGAHARWRTLHEIAVVSLLLKDGGEELAQRYQDHGVIKSYREAKKYNEHVVLLGWEPIPQDELAQMERRASAMLAKYGKPFNGEYGWASGINGIASPGIGDLEAAARVQKWRSFSSWASSAVHAGPQGFHSLSAGLEPNPALILAGPSNAGLADPGQNTALTLVLIANALYAHRPNGQRAVLLGALQILSERAQSEFIQAHEEVERRTTELRSAVKKAATRAKRGTSSKRRPPRKHRDV